MTARVFLDLLPGWRLTAVTPLIQDTPSAPWRYGRVEGKATLQNGLNVTLQLSAEQRFGFETARYAVEARGLRFLEATRNLEGVSSAATAPLLRLFPATERKQFVRILFLTRASNLEYNTALLSAPKAADMAAFTQAVREAPETACREEAKRWCAWIPPGVAVTAEKPVSGGFQPAL